MKVTTLGYLIRDNSFLMLHRTKKKHDPNEGKWIGVGGHIEEGETPDECFRREVKEETGLTLGTLHLRGIITFISDEWEDELMFLYTSDDCSGELIECNEGELAFIPKDQVLSLPTWEGDRIFLRELLQNAPFFTLKLKYQGDNLVETKLDRSPT